MDEGVYRSQRSNGEDGEDMENLVEPFIKKAEHKSGKRKGNRCLIIVIVLLAVALCVVILALIGGIIGVIVERNKILSNTSANDDGDDDVCNTVGCVQLSAQISSRLNMSVDPCEDFIEFSCGGWKKNHVIPPGPEMLYRLDPNELQIDPVNVRLQKALSGSDRGVEAARKAIDFYQACINAYAILTAVGNEPLYQLLNTVGGWELIGVPATGQWSINSNYFYYEKLHGNPAFISYQIRNDVTDPSKYIIHFLQPDFSGNIIKQGYTNETLSMAETIFLDVLKKYSRSNTSDSSFLTAVREVIDLNTQMVDILEPVPVALSNNVTTLSNISNQWPWFRWEEFVRYALTSLGYTNVDPNNLRYIVDTPTYFQKLGVLLQNTSQDVIQNFARIYFVGNYVFYLDPNNRNPLLAVKPGDLTYCLKRTEQLLPLALARLYVELYVPKQLKERVQTDVEYVLRSFRARVQRKEWLSDLSRQRSLEKLDNLLENVAYPDQLLNDTYLNELYSIFTVTSTDFFGNNVRSYDIVNRLQFGLWISGYNRQIWNAFIAPTAANAFYEVNFNQIYILLGNSLPPLFSTDWPDYYNFGGFGTTIGHETTHGYDSRGQQYDQNGVRQKWWSDESQQEFNTRLLCFVNQYNNYTILGVPTNGLTTLAENIADNGGIQTSFEAYKMKVMESGRPSQRLPSLPYTPDQLFFISFAAGGCELGTRQAYETQVQIDPHSPGPIRIIGSLMNTEAFAKAFNCPVGSKMNPAGRERCQLW